MATLASTGTLRTQGVFDDRIRREVRIFQSPVTRYGAVLLTLLAVVLPLSTADSFLLSLGITVGFFSIAAIGLNVLNGYAGQINMGQPFFLAIGAFTAVGFGSIMDLPLPLWLLAVVVVGAVSGALVAPLALRLKGVYQIVLSLGLIFIGQYIFVNWSDLTGGVAGRRAAVNLSVGPLDFAALQVGGMTYNYQQGLFMLVWLFVALCMFLVHLLMKSPGGRHIVALRDADLPARVAGINPVRSMVGAYAISSAMGALGGAFYVAQLRFVSPEQFNLAMGLNFIIIVTVGGLATAWGPVVGSLIICSIPVLASRYAEFIPFLKANSSTPDGTWGIPVGQFPVVLYGVLLVLILMFEPRGLTHLLKVFGLWLTRPLRRRRTASSGEGTA
ncbi:MULTISPECIES: branched-chain amino acid ABC transporter permease [Microbacterium]|uniref:Branched-chain amino acid ABC transporter permease n=1 Tax=Microbacterium wangchenii TaxID=2541726 RepID=A0ABX5SVY7_9MICO|nr:MULTISPECIES: branched-chain amino acid ABC transporter permease [Microbacterium]MCK6066025.1 branched-chain amino acid ABC transporter permease [Microbacterium sp. EYE_512]QBR90314.1 branched-chain amino acid ABC transporter permease [Microbacterium wangchenii]TFV84875.1 branched-chain amino acid ABC transporter permease [Microbacterium sp. dk485]TXK11671.1 branched-chain amino acid ABC transporter permease [Microbacterium wangchenii]